MHHDDNTTDAKQLPDRNSPLLIKIVINKLKKVFLALLRSLNFETIKLLFK